MNTRPSGCGSALGIWFICLFLVHWSYAQESKLDAELPGEPVLALGHFLDRFEDRHPALRELESQIRELEQQRRIRKAEEGWRLSAAARLSTADEGLARDGFARNSASVAIARDIPGTFGPRLARARDWTDRAEMVALDLQSRALRNVMVRDLTINYARYAFSYEALGHIVEAMNLLQRKREVLHQQASREETLRLHVLETDSELEAWKYKEQIYRRQLTYYCELLKVDADDELPVFKPVPLEYGAYVRALPPPMEDLLARALREDPALRALRERQEAAWLAAPRWGSFPLSGEVRAGPRYTQTDLNETVDFELGVSLRLPLAAKSLAGARAARERERAHQLDAQADMRKLELTRQLRTWYYHVLEYRQALRAARAKLAHGYERVRVLTLQGLYTPQEIQGDPIVQGLNARIGLKTTVVDQLLAARADLVEAVSHLQYLGRTRFAVDETVLSDTSAATLWIRDQDILAEEDARQLFWLHAGLLGVGRICLDLPTADRKLWLGKRKRKLADFLAELHGRGIEAEMVLGRPGVSGEETGGFEDELAAWIEYQTWAEGPARWDGVHIDLRSRERPADPGLLVARWTDLLGALKQRLRERVRSQIQMRRDQRDHPDQNVPVARLHHDYRLFVTLPAWLEKDAVDEAAWFDLAGEVDGWVLSWQSRESDAVPRLAALPAVATRIALNSADVAALAGKPLRLQLDAVREKLAGTLAVFPWYDGMVLPDYHQLKPRLPSGLTESVP